MIRYATPTDPLRLFREEEAEEGSLLNKAEFDLTESLAIIREMLDRLHTDPGDDCVRNVLEYSRLMNTR